ncbi:MAG: DNA cytosine methyltransferase [Bacilli bacterium]|nr:DNA cytosine methyltransferase [Bacilli bacterium]
MAVKFIDLFAGIGGIRIPFEELGYECVFSSEIDKFAVETYKANFNDTPYGDIKTIKPRDIPKHDLLLAGFPCQPFSQAGLKKGLEDERGTFIFDIIKIVKEHKPKVVFLENVKRFYTSNNNLIYMMVKTEFEKMGYNFFFQIYNSKDFGIPQNRERVYMVAIRDKRRKFNFPKPSYIVTRVGQILDKNVNEKYTISDKLWAGHQRRKKEHMSKGNGFGYSLFDHKSPYTNTISARYYKDGSEILINQKDKNPRKLTPREAARLQGFPESFKIVVNDVQAYKQFGNSVSVPVIRAIAKEIDNIM